MRTKQILSITLLVVIILAGPFSQWRARRADHSRELATLHSVGVYCRLYADDHAGHFPSNLYAGDDEVLLRRFLYVDGDTNSGPTFCYVDWGADVNANLLPLLPILYHRSQVKGGIGILFGDGHVEWDENARWLGKFSETNGLKKLSLPD